MNTNTLTETERNALLAALAEAKQSGLTMVSKKSAAHRRCQLFLAPDEHAGLQVMKHTTAFHVGRPVAQTLIVRLALRRLMEECRRSLADPVVAAKMKADLMAVRAERASVTP